MLTLRKSEAHKGVKTMDLLICSHALGQSKLLRTQHCLPFTDNPQSKFLDLDLLLALSAIPKLLQIISTGTSNAAAFL
jgi:hypothetical protein